MVGQLCVTAAQLGTHYANDYFDLAADRANRTPTSWSGGSRVLPDGVLSPVVALRTAVVLFGAAVGFALALAATMSGAGLTLPIAATMIALAWAYSAPPARFCARGLGELTTAIVTVTGCWCPCYRYALAGARAVRAPVLLAAALPSALQFAMLLAIEFPDAAGDAATGKAHCWSLRLGGAAASRLYAAVTLAGFAVLPLAAVAGAPGAGGHRAAGLALIAIWQVWRGWCGARLQGARALGERRVLVGGAARGQRGGRARRRARHHRRQHRRLKVDSARDAQEGAHHGR